MEIMQFKQNETQKSETRKSATLKERNVKRVQHEKCI